MKTTILGVGEIGTRVLEECLGLSETELMSYSNNTSLAEAAVHLTGDMVISVAAAAPNESMELSGLLRGDERSESLTLELVILPFESSFSPADYHTAKRNVIFLPQEKTSFKSETDYYERCISEAADCIKLLKRLIDSVEEVNIISLDMIDVIEALNKNNDQETSKFIFHVSGDLDTCQDKLRKNKLLTADTASVVMMCYFPESVLICEAAEITNCCGDIDRVCQGVSISKEFSEYELIVLGVNCC